MQKCTEAGKVLKRLMISENENGFDQAEKLGVSYSQLYLLQKGGKSFTPKIVNKIFEVYSVSEADKEILKKSLIKEEVHTRFAALFPDITLDEQIYIFYGEAVK